MARKLGAIHRRIVEVLRARPYGVSLNEIATILEIPPGEQMHFDRRLRELDADFNIRRRRQGSKVLYILEGSKETPLDDAAISKTLRAAVLRSARGTCAMCGKTIEKDRVRLVIDHKVPHAWGGLTEAENLWALCSECNEGKKAFFSSVDSPELRSALSHKSVHVRIGELLKANVGKPVDSYLIELVANQNDWPKRTRELRYLGWKIEVTKRVSDSGTVYSAYRLQSFSEWPADPSKVIRDYERDRSTRKPKRKPNAESAEDDD
ncbi:MAG TPA: HNH endonuclease [Gemmatimonadaceae bacterium]|nr:HNH endonuclease [Gemmatimonadaceae bacterium]